MSGLYPVTPTAHRTRKYAPWAKLLLEHVEESSPLAKHIRRLPAEVMDISSDEELSSLDAAIQLKHLRGSRKLVTKVPVEVVSLSSSNEDSSPDENMPIKCLRTTAAPVQQMPINAASLLSGECSPSKLAVTNVGIPSLPQSAVTDVVEKIRRAIRHIRKDDAAREKTADQMDMLIAVISARTDLVITMRTGGGKSMSWMIPSVMDEDDRSIVVCPFIALLDQQFMATASTGLHCHNYCVSKVVPENVQILFMQVEHCSSHAFESLLASPLGQKFTRVFVDEFHDIANCHPGRVVPWKNLAQQFGKTLIRIVLMTGTGPPHHITNFIKPFGMHLGIVTQVRSDTNHPEIGMHVIHIQPIAAMQSLGHLVSALCKRLVEEEHILVFCGSQGDAQAFAVKANCAIYHSDLWEVGNSRESNLSRWDSGQTKVMACTTAFAQGMDRPHVRYIVIFKPSYGLLVNNQMLRRAGRDGKESHVFFLTDRRAKSYRGPSTDQCVGELDDLVYGTECRRFTNMICMDGHNLAVRCTDDPPGIHCDAIANPFRPPKVSQHAVTPVFASGSMLQGPTHAPPPVYAGFVPVLSLLSMNAISHTLTPQPSQSSDALYDAGALELTSFQGLMLNAMEEFHGKGKGESSDRSYMTKSQPFPGRAIQIEPPSTSSLPSGSSTFVTARLDKYMKVLKDKCPSHFGNGGCLVPAANHRCTMDSVLPMDLNGEEPACHAGFSYRKGERCPFAGFIFKAVFCMWHNPGFRQLMMSEIGKGASLASYEDFVAWIVKDSTDAGRYNNLVEAFLWFCSGLEKVNPKFFD
ncbi:P-loop containing nucleoside triphosphate hydrolase protein [Suillus variegatus]|nr:P-loop containing nucleoside triphosphate hydrolase protein [Suillus variegatus]